MSRKICRIFGCCIAMPLVLFAESEYPGANLDRVRAAHILEKAADGDWRASLREIAKLSPTVSVPILAAAAEDRGAQDGVRAYVVEILRGDAKILIFLKDDLELATKEGNVNRADFSALGLIATPAAAEIASKYLFDSTKVVLGDDIGSLENRYAAVFALKMMQLSDAPKSNSSVGVNDLDLEDWQKWSIDKGFVPKEWRLKVAGSATIEGEAVKQIGNARSVEQNSASNSGVASQNAGNDVPSPDAAAPYTHEARISEVSRRSYLGPAIIGGIGVLLVFIIRKMPRR